MGVLRSVLGAIGNTPVVELRKIVSPGSARVLVKLEQGNPTGSYKDRMALAMIEGAEKRGVLQPGQRVVEYTGGSTGTSLALVCALKGYPLTIVTSDAFSAEKLRTIAAFGAKLVIVPSDNGVITPDLIPRMMETAKEIAQGEGGYQTDQFNNVDMVEGYRSMALELLNQVDGPIDAFCGGVGTGGMLTGVARELRDSGQETKIVALEPASSPVLTAGRAGPHHVEGIGAGFAPPLVRENVYDEARTVEEPEARELARNLAREEGIFAGISTGLNVAGALVLAREFGPGHTVVTVAVDSGLKYLSGDLFAI